MYVHPHAKLTPNMDQYSKIGKQFQKTAPKALLRKSLLTPTFIDSVGDLKGKSCLDLACGDGYYTRILKDKGAKSVVGVDISDTMVELAKKEEAKFNQGIEYLVGDVATLKDLGQFDLVTAVFLLHYAKTKEELLKMCIGIRKSTGKSRRFITINTNPEYPIREDSKYSFTRTGLTPLKEGALLTLSHYEDAKSMYSFDFYHWSKQTYDWALTSAGFKKIQWRVPQITKEAIEEFGSAFWEDYQKEPNHSVIICE
jgi:ubiquinone/menaquinone biosynthesis C-methylase UbiE